MTQYGAPFDGIALGDATKAPYSAAEWARIWMLRHGVGASFPNYGVIPGTGGGSYPPLYVLAQNPVSANVDVQVGAALIQGYFYETTAVVTLTVGANASGNARVDAVVLRLDFASQTIRLAIKQGTPAASPVAPTMQQDASFWEIPIANIAVANGFTTLAQTTITQRQRAVPSSFMGWLPYAYPIPYVTNPNFEGVDGISHTLAANGDSFALPVFLSANLLLHDVMFRTATLSTAYEWGWDLYKQDTNDGLTAENTLRRVLQSNGNSTGTTPGAASNLTHTPAGGATPLEPGLYWLVIQNRHATNTLTMRAIQNLSTLDNGLALWKRKPTTNPNGATLDFVAATWNSVVSYPAVKLRGRVFGQATVYS